MTRILLAVAALLALAAPGVARAQADQQTLVDRATLTVQDMMNQTVSQDPRTMLQKARAVMICPRVFKAGFILGGEGGSCVLLARAGNGTWSYPAFYGMGSGSIGFQAGIEDNQLIMMVMTEKGLNAVMDSQFKLGANASIALFTLGAGVQGSTTAAVGADIIAFASSRGLYGGVSIEGSIMSIRSNWNKAYYGQPYSARQIVIEMQGANPGADPLREILTRYGSGTATAAASGPQPAQQAPGYAPAYPSQGQAGPQQAPTGQAPVQLQPSAPVTQQNLAPPGR